MLGIDVDQTGFRAARTGRAGEQIQLTDLAYAHPALSEDQTTGMQLPESRIEALREQVDRNVPGGIECILGASGTDLNLRYLSLPAADRADLENMVEMEVTGMMGVENREELVYDHMVLGPSEDQSIPLLISLLRKNWLKEATEAVERGNRTLEAVSPISTAISTLVRNTGQTDDKLRFYVSIGYNSMDTVLMRGDSLLAARNSSGGLSSIARATADPDEEPIDVYERVFFRQKQPDPSVRTNTTQLADRISRAYEYCVREFPDLPDAPEIFSITGEGARVPWLRSELENALQTNVDILNPIPHLDLGSLDDTAKKRARDLGPELTGAIGLSLCELDASSDKNLIIPTFSRRRRRQWRQMELPVLIGFSVLIVALIAGIFLTAQTREPLEDRVQNMEARLRDLQDRQAAQSRLEENLNTALEQNRELAELHRSGNGVLEAFRQIPVFLPGQLVVNELQIPADGGLHEIQLRGAAELSLAETGSLVEQFSEDVEANTPFTVNLSAPEEGNAEQTLFEITLTYQPDQTEDS